MSRIGLRPITVPANVELTIAEGNHVAVKGPKGSLSASFSPDLSIVRENGHLNVTVRATIGPTGRCTG
jgi:large subunit ribosomal protein L6